MLAEKPESEKPLLSKWVDNYVDADGWRPNTADKHVLYEAIRILNNVPDTKAQKIEALEKIRDFDQKGEEAAKWLKSSLTPSPYSEDLREVLKKLIGIWNRKLRGIKTYVFVNEVINYIIYEFNQQAEGELRPFVIPEPRSSFSTSSSSATHALKEGSVSRPTQAPMPNPMPAQAPGPAPTAPILKPQAQQTPEILQDKLLFMQKKIDELLKRVEDLERNTGGNKPQL